MLGLDHVVLRVRDVPRALGFYRDVLGCPVEREIEALGLTQLRAGNSLIDLVDVAAPLGQAGGGPPDPKARNVDHFCLRVEPFDEAALRSHLEAHGLTASDVGTRYGADGSGPSLYIEDPEGNVVELKGAPTEPPLGGPAAG